MTAFEPMMDDPLERVELALQDLRAGRMVILVDDEDRENEGDLVLAAEKATPASINFMATHARGLICLTLTSDQVARLGLPMMATNNQSAYQTAFTVSIEARHGVSTGISAADRAHTTLVAIDAKATPRDIVSPGHVFPLRARDGGVLERVGQTEGSVDLARMAGLNPSGVICEIMNADGTMSRLPQLQAFGREHHIRIVAVADVIKYRMRNERVVRRVSEAPIEVEGLGTWNSRLYRSIGAPGLHLALWLGELNTEPTLVRVQGAPPAWAALNPHTNRTARTLREAMQRVREVGRGAIVLMHTAPSLEQLHGAWSREFGGEDAVVATQPRAAELRDLGTGCQILADLGLSQLDLITQNRRPVVGIEAYGLSIHDWVEIR